MLNDINNPGWILEVEESANKTTEAVRERLRKIKCDYPEITVCIAAYNEEDTILQCIDSLSRSATIVPFEIIVVNNNSTDKTQEILDQLEVTSFFEKEQGCGLARETGQQKARGKYILMADADCVYPKNWIDLMYNHLRQKGVVAVYSKHSFIGDEVTPRWKYALYEAGKNLIQEIRNFKRPYLNAYGMSFGYVKELGIKEGYVRKNIRGEDGRLCYDLMKYGKVKMIRAKGARVWTKERNFIKEGGMGAALRKRMLREVLRFADYFQPPKKHNTKESENSELTESEYKKLIKEKWLKNN